MKRFLLAAALVLTACSTKAYTPADYFQYLQSQNIQVQSSEIDPSTFQATADGLTFKVIREANGADAVATATRINVPQAASGKTAEGALETAANGQEAVREKAHVKGNLVLVFAEADNNKPEAKNLTRFFQKF